MCSVYKGVEEKSGTLEGEGLRAGSSRDRFVFLTRDVQRADRPVVLKRARNELPEGQGPGQFVFSLT